MKAAIEVNTPALAEACNLTPRRVQILAVEGVFAKKSRGRFDLVPCLRAYVRYLQTALTAKGTMRDDGEVTTTKRQRAKLLDVELAREELALAKDRGEVMAVEDHEAILSSLVIETKARVMAIGARVSKDIAGETSRAKIQAAIDAEARVSLAELAKITPALPAEGDAAEQKPRTPARKRRKKRTSRMRRAHRKPRTPAVPTTESPPPAQPAG